jgi:hypothetical protein
MRRQVNASLHRPVPSSLRADEASVIFSTFPFNVELRESDRTFDVGLFDLRAALLAAMAVDMEVTNSSYQAFPKQIELFQTIHAGLIRSSHELRVAVEHYARDQHAFEVGGSTQGG